MSGRYRWYGIDRSTASLRAPDGRQIDSWDGPRFIEEYHAEDILTNELNTLLDRAEKAEARVAELERDVATWSPARHYGEYEPDWEPIESGLRDRIPREPAKGEVWIPAGTPAPRCQTHGYAYSSETWGLSSPPVLLGVSCLKCSWKSGPVGRFTVTEVDDGANTVTISSEPITKTAPKTPVPEEEDDDSKPEPSVVELQQRIATAKVGYYAPCAWCWSTVFAPNGEQVTCHKCGRKTPVPAPEGTEIAENQAPAAGTGPSCRDRAPRGVAAGVEPAPVLGDSRGSEDPKLVVSCYDERCRCYQCVKDRWEAARAEPTTRVEATPRPTRPPPGICELWESDGRYFGKYAENGPDVELSVAQPDTGLVRVLVDPAAAAEVEARTGAVATDTLRATVTWGPASPENMLTFTTPDAWIVTPPRAGLPSRDEVAAFLEGLKPEDNSVAKGCVDPECGICQKGWGMPK